MKKHYYLLCFAILFAACNSNLSKEELIKQRMLALEDSIRKTFYPDSLLDVTVVAGKKFGVLHNKISCEDLQKIYGENQVKTYRDTVSKQAYATSVLFEGQPNELEIMWHNEELLQYPRICYFKNPKAVWEADKGIKMGTSLAEIVKLNETAVEIVGLGNEFEGGLVRYKDGKLKDFGKYYNIFLGYDKTENPTLDAAITGTNPFLSDLPALKNVQLKVVKIQVYLNK